MGLPHVRLVSKAFEFWGTNGEAEMETYWATPVLRRWSLGRTLLTGEQAPFFKLVPKKALQHLPRRLIHKFYTPHRRHGYYLNKRFQPSQKRFTPLKVAHKVIDNRVFKKKLSTPARWNVFFKNSNHASGFTFTTIYNKENDLQLLNEHKNAIGVELPWASVVTPSLKTLYFNEQMLRPLFSFSWRRSRIGQKLRSLKSRKRRRYSRPWWFPRILRKYSPLQQIIRDFIVRERTLRYGYRKVVRLRTRALHRSRLNLRWRRRKLKKYTLKRQEAMNQKLKFRRRKRRNSVRRRTNYILKRYYKLLQYRSGYKWRSLTAVTARHRMNVRNYSIMRFDPFVKKKRRASRRFKRRRKWLPKGFYRYRRRYKRLIRPIRLHGWTWFNLPTGNDYVTFDDRRIGFIKLGGTFYFPKIVPNRSLHAPRRPALEVTTQFKTRNYNRSVAGVTRGFKKVLKALAAGGHSRSKHLKRLTLNPKSVQRFSLYKRFASTKGNPKVDQRDITLNYKEITNGYWGQRFKEYKDDLSPWVVACHEKDKPYRRSFIQGFDVTTKFFNLFLKKGAKHTLEKLIRQFRTKNPRWSVIRLYHKLYTPVGLMTSTKTKIKDGKLQRVKRQTAKINRWQKGFIRARKWVIKGVRGRRERKWWSRVTSEIIMLRSALRFRNRYIRSIVTLGRVL